MRWPLILAVLSVSGCGSAQEPDAKDAGGQGDAPLFARGSLTFTFTNVETPFPDVTGDNGCFIDAPDVTRVLNGTVALTWAAGPTTDALRLQVLSTGPGIVAAYADDAQGPSPLELALRDVPVPGSLSFSVHAPEPGAAYQQTVTLSWALTYEGKPADEWSAGGCPATP